MGSLINTREDKAPGVSAFWFEADGWVPNSARLPLIVYRAAIASGGRDPAAAFEDAFQRNGWPPEWRNGVYPFHHYHSTAHEVLGFAAGQARLLLGGPSGQEFTVNPGDCALLPAGTGHCCLDASQDFLVVGAYPPGQQWDLLRKGLSEEAKARMAKVPFPSTDPVLGSDGPLVRLWSQSA